MNILRFATKLNASEFASWVQAIGSIIAILSGFLVEPVSFAELANIKESQLLTDEEFSKLVSRTSGPSE